jgi:hypothetical protein
VRRPDLDGTSLPVSGETGAEVVKPSRGHRETSAAECEAMSIAEHDSARDRLALSGGIDLG